MTWRPYDTPRAVHVLVDGRWWPGECRGWLWRDGGWWASVLWTAGVGRRHVDVVPPGRVRED